VNERDIELARVIASEVETDGETPIYLLVTRYTSLVRLNLVLLKAFLDEKCMKGVVITLDRPHQYLSHLLVLHGVDTKNLRFIDAISVHSSDSKAGTSTSGFEQGPFHIESLPTYFCSPGDNRQVSLVDLSSTEFIIIDNVATLLAYNTMDSITGFFREYVRVLGGLNARPIVTAVVLDKDLHPDLYRFVLDISRKCMEIGPDMELRQISMLGPREGPANGTKPGACSGPKGSNPSTQEIGV